jgi:hypothetical protein
MLNTLFLHEVLHEKRFDGSPRIAPAGTDHGVNISLYLTRSVWCLHLVSHRNLLLETQAYPTRISTRYKSVHDMF